MDSSVLTLDFGIVGFHYEREPFRVRVDAEAFEALIADTRNAWRVYELTLIQRPGDVWEYVWVTPESVPRRVAEQIESARAAAMPRFGKVHPWPEGKVPFAVFDRFFYAAGDDTTPDSDAWFGGRGGPTSLARDLCERAQVALAELDGNDVLLRHELQLARTHTHWCSLQDRTGALDRVRDRFYAPQPPKFTPAFYEQLSKLLDDPDLVSVAFRGKGDWTLMRMLSTEQRRRAEATGHQLTHALHLSVSSDYRAGVDAWGAWVHFHYEGLAHGDLFIEDEGCGSSSVKELIEKYRRCPRVVLVETVDFEIAGYRRETGEGWVMFRRIEPSTRRANMELIARYRDPHHFPVLQFDGLGGAVYAFDRGLIVVGDGLSGDALAAAASLLEAWRERGRDLLVIGVGGPLIFENVGLAGAVMVPDSLHDTGDDDKREWFAGLLREHQPWTDVALLLTAPEWLSRAAHAVLDKRSSPWRPWVVETTGTAGTTADRVLAADPAAELRDALTRAAAYKLKLLP
jgi:hypothetical protein